MNSTLHLGHTIYQVNVNEDFAIRDDSLERAAFDVSHCLLEYHDSSLCFGYGRYAVLCTSQQMGLVKYSETYSKMPYEV